MGFKNPDRKMSEEINAQFFSTLLFRRLIFAICPCIALQKDTRKPLPSLDDFSKSSQRTCCLIQKCSHKHFFMVAPMLSHLRERLRGDKDYRQVRAPENCSGQHGITINTTRRTSIGRSLRVRIHILVTWSKSIFKTS